MGIACAPGWARRVPTPAKPLAAAEQSLLDKAKLVLQELALEERAYLADGWVGVRINIQGGVLKGKPRRLTEVSRP